MKWTMRSALEQAHELYMIEHRRAIVDGDEQAENFWLSHAATVRSVLDEPERVRVALEKCVEVMGKCAPSSWGRAMQETHAADDYSEGLRVLELAPDFYAAFRAGKDALKL